MDIAQSLPLATSQQAHQISADVMNDYLDVPDFNRLSLCLWLKAKAGAVARSLAQHYTLSSLVHKKKPPAIG